jgi:FKBP-type peptidyl-prolyl cis-trans isomerase FkpA
LLRSHAYSRLIIAVYAKFFCGAYLMTVTAVPLQPVKKSSLITLWVGILALLAGAAAFAYHTTPRLGFDVVKAGTGASPKDSDVALINYVGKLKDGTVFDKAEKAPLEVGRVVPGFSQALKRMQKGGKYKVTIPPKLGYGAQATGPIPANSTLVFEVELIEFQNADQVRQMQQMIQQQMQQQQGGAQGGPQGGPPNPAGAR